MKKTYLKPETLTVKIANHIMLITSGSEADQNGEVLTRRNRFSRWEDDEFEE